MRKRFKPRGYTLIELIVVIMILGILASATGSILLSLVSSFELSQNKNNVNFIAQRAITKITDEVRQSISFPDSLRLWVSSDGKVLRFYLSEGYSDSIRYYFAPSGGDTFLYRAYADNSGELVPSFAGKFVDYQKGSFSVDSSGVGFSTSGRVNLALKVGRIYGTEPDSNTFSTEMYSRNYE